MTVLHSEKQEDDSVHSEADAEEKLRQSEDRMRVMISSIHDYGIFVLDPSGNVASWNEGAKRIKGYSEEEILGRHFSIFYPPETKDSKWPEYELSVAARDGGFEDEGWRVRKNGELFWANVVITALRSNDGKLIGFTKVTRDLTERRKHEEALRESERQLAVANRNLAVRNRELQDFARVASHDLQEPLRKITAFAQLLEEDYHDVFDEDGRMYLDRITNASQRLSTLIVELLNYSRLAVAHPANFRRVDLNQLIDDVRRDLQVRLSEVDGQIERGNLPIIEGDPTQMRQLFQNLLGNALKFHRPGVPPVVKISSVPALLEGGVEGHEIRVRDNGIGFEEKYVDRIFAPFQRLHSVNAYEGTGLGLAICQKIVERHQGTISVRSELDVGTEFTVRLPAVAQTGEED